jgi:hypothetical protein
MKSTANKTRPKVMNAGMDRPHWMAIAKWQAVARNDYGRFAAAFQTIKSKPSASGAAAIHQSVFQRSVPADLIRGWTPARVKKPRQNKNLEPRYDSIETETL